MADHSFYDEVWGKWYFEDQPVKVAKLENGFGDRFTNYMFSAFKENVIGTRIELVADPVGLTFGLIIGGGISAAWDHYQNTRGPSNDRPWSPYLKFAAGVAINLKGVGLPLLLGPSGKTNITMADNSDLMYFGNSVKVRRSVNSFEFNFKSDSEWHNYVLVILMAGISGIIATGLAIRLAWYDFDPDLADPGLAETTKNGEVKFQKKMKADSNWNTRWDTPNEACKFWIPLVEATWASLLLLFENMLPRLVTYTEWRLKYLRQGLAQNQWDLENLERWGPCFLTKDLFGDTIIDESKTVATVTEEVAKLEAEIAKYQADLDKYTTEITNATKG